MPLKADDQPPVPGAPPINTNDLVNFIARLDILPGKTCEAGVNCENGAEFFVDQHGCDQLLVCGEHRRMWIHELNTGIVNGWCVCPECRGEFTSITDILTERPV